MHDPLFEPHTQVIPRFKAGKPAEFGRKLRIDEVEGGIIVGYEVLESGGQDQKHLADARRITGGSSDGPRGCWRPTSGCRRPRTSGWRSRPASYTWPYRTSARPHRGESEEKGRRFREAYRFRAGIEGRIHALKRDYGLRRCRYRGERGFGRWVGWGVLAHNLAKVARAAGR